MNSERRRLEIATVRARADNLHANLTKRTVGVAVLSAIVALGAATANAAVTFSFEGTSQYDNVALAGLNNFIPPDTMGAIGVTQYMEFTNGSIAVYDRTNGALLAPRVTMQNFWANAGQAAAANGDQRVLFDHYTNRWIAVGFGGSVSNINIAVSDTSNALGSWKSTQLAAFPGGTADYPTLGMDDKGVYIGTNNFNSTGSFKGVSLFSIPKSDLFSGTPTLSNMTVFNTPYPGTGGDQGFAIQAAVNWGGNPTNTASVMADSLLQANDVFYKISGVNAAGATETTATHVVGSDYPNAAVPKGRQPDGTRIIDTLDTRISANVMEASGKLYSVRTIDLNNAAALRWSVNDASTGALISMGTIDDPNYDYFQGSIAVNSYGQVVIGYNRSGWQTTDANSDGFADGNVSFMAREYNSDGLGNLVETAEDLLKVSLVSDYHNGSVFGQPAAGRQRWGDFSTVTLDPTNQENFWAIGEFAREWNNPASGHPGGTGGSRWGTWVSEISLHPVPDTSSSLSLMAIGLLAIVALRRRIGTTG